MTPEPTRRKSQRTSATSWKEGDTRSLFRAPGRRAPEEIAAARKKAAEERESKKQTMKEKGEKTARDILQAARLEDSLAKKREEAEGAFPRRRSDIDDTQPDEESSAQKPLNSSKPRRQAQPNRGGSVVESSTSQEPVRGDTSSKTRDRPLKRSYAVMDLEAEIAMLREKLKKKRGRGAASEAADESTNDEKGGAGKPSVTRKPKARAVLKERQRSKKDSRPGSEELEDADPFDLRHRKRASQTISPSSEREDVAPMSEEEERTPRPNRTTSKTRVIDGISNLASTDDTEWDGEGEGDTDILVSSDSSTMEEDDDNDAGPESPLKQKSKAGSSKNKEAGKGKGKDMLRTAISQGRQRKQPEVEPFQQAVNNKDLRRAKATSGVSEAWLRQQEKDSVTQTRRGLTEDSDSDARSSKKKRITTSGVVVVAHAQLLPSKKSRSASTSIDSENVRDNDVVQTSARYGGLEDEDDTEEREAVKRSPVKAEGVRISDHAIVKVESPVKVKLPTKISGFKIHHLPVGAHAKWRQGFVTTFAAYIGTKSSPWDLKDKETLDAMQNCWNHVYQTTAAAQHRISGFHDVVFVLGDQKWKELRNMIASTAVQALDEYFKLHDFNTNLQRREEAAKLCESKRFIYRTAERNDDGKLILKKPFYNPLILKTFGYFFKWTKTRDKSWPMIKGKPPIGALGLATAAVERALHFWSKLPVSDETANQPAVKPFNKRKAKTAKSEPLDDPPEEANASGDTRKEEEDCFGKIKEFSADLWGSYTKQWIIGAKGLSFDSEAIMQPLVDAATEALDQGSSKRSSSVAPILNLDQSSCSRVNIAEGIISDAE